MSVMSASAANSAASSVKWRSHHPDPMLAHFDRPPTGGTVDGS